MFWGLVLEPGKRYSTTVEKSFHVSNAALDCSSLRNDNEILSVVLETEGSQILLCNLCKQKGILQENLDLNFMSGDRLTFECRGHGRIHLSGYLLPDDDDDMSGMLGDEESEEEEEEEESEWPATANTEKPKKEKRSNESPPDVVSKKKKIKKEEGESESEEDESDYLEGLQDQDDDDDDDDDDEEEEDDEASDGDEDESEEEEENKINLSQKEKQKLQKQDKSKTPNKQNVATPKKTPVTNGVSPKEQKLNKKTPGGDKTPNTNVTPNANATPKQKQVLDQGVVVKEIKVGSGPPAKPGRTVTVYYMGRLKENGKVFDKQIKGEGFKFKLGKGEVIKGWDIGVQGMRVGGKRTIHCPPDVAYGAKGVPPKIPPNSTLTFEVELKSVH